MTLLVSLSYTISKTKARLSSLQQFTIDRDIPFRESERAWVDAQRAMEAVPKLDDLFNSAGIQLNPSLKFDGRRYELFFFFNRRKADGVVQVFRPWLLDF